MAFDSNFELKFAELVSARLEEKASQIFPFRVGFQLIDKSEDDTRGVGVMAFLMDGKWLYVPAFFLKGRLKGMEMLYVKNLDLFVPLSDAWISYLRKNDTRTMGKGIGRDQVKTRKPDMIHIMLAPNEKISSETYIDPETITKMAAQMFEMGPGLLEEMPKMGPRVFQKLAEWMDKDNDFANALLKYYSPEDFRKAAKAADELIKKACPDGGAPAHGEKIDTKAAGPALPELPVKTEGGSPDEGGDAERVESKTAAAKDENGSLQPGDVNPGPSDAKRRSTADDAVYKSKTNSPEKRTEEVQEAAADNPVARDTRDTKPKAQVNAAQAMVKRTEGTDQLQVIYPGDPRALFLKDDEKNALMRDGVFIKDERTGTASVFNAEPRSKRFENPTKSGLYDILLADGSTMAALIVFPAVRMNKRMVCADPRRNLLMEGATRPDNHVAVINLAEPDVFRMKPARELLCAQASKMDEEVYNKLKSIPEFTREKFLQLKGRRMLLMDRKGNAGLVDLPWECDGRRRYIRGNDTLPIGGSPRDSVLKFTKREGKLAVLKDVMLVPEGCVCFEETWERCPYTLGSINTVVTQMSKAANVSPLKIYSDHNGYAIDGAKGQKMSLNKMAATLHLVKDYNIKAELAKQMLADASDHQGARPASRRYMVKSAEYYELQATQPGSGARRSFQRAPLSQERELMPARALQTAVDASNKGVKEVVDASALAALAGTTHSLELMGEYLSDLVKSMDKLGRLLFLYYWHNDEFREQYGAQEMTELEESLRSVFDGTGDLVLFLREKSVDFDPLFGGDRGDKAEELGGDAGSSKELIG